MCDTDFCNDIRSDVKMVSVKECLDRISSTMDCGYITRPERLIAMMCYKLTDNNHIPAIIRAIETDGFNVPICIVENYDGSWFLGNGHHRFVAALLMGLDEILVDFSDSHSGMSENNYFAIDEDSVRNAENDNVDCEFLYNHLFDMLVDWVGTEQIAQEYISDCMY